MERRHFYSNSLILDNYSPKWRVNIHRYSPTLSRIIILVVQYSRIVTSFYDEMGFARFFLRKPPGGEYHLIFPEEPIKSHKKHHFSLALYILIISRAFPGRQSQSRHGLILPLLCRAASRIFPFCSFASSDECDTWRTRSGLCCVFPDLYAGSLYHSCTRYTSALYYCSLTADYESDYEIDWCDGEPREQFHWITGMLPRHERDR